MSLGKVADIPLLWLGYKVFPHKGSYLTGWCSAGDVILEGCGLAEGRRLLGCDRRECRGLQFQRSLCAVVFFALRHAAPSTHPRPHGTLPHREPRSVKAN